MSGIDGDSSAGLFRKYFLLFVASEFALLFLAFSTQNPFYVIGFILLIGGFYSTVKWPELVFFILLLYLSLIPVQSWGEQYDLFPVYINRFVVLLLIFYLAVLSVLHYLTKKDDYSTFSILDKLVLIFIIYSVFSLVWGLYWSGNNYHALTEFYNLFLYSSYFVVRYLVIHRNMFIKAFLIVLVICSTFASIEYIFLALTNLDLASLFVTRVTTQQPHLAQISIPLLASYFLFQKKMYHKILISLLLLINLVMVIFSQQRGLWVGTFLSLMVVSFLYNFRNGISMKRFVQFFSALIAIIFGLIILVLILDKILNLTVILTVFRRIESLTQLSVDESLRIRLTEIGLALQSWKNSWFIGTGFGDTYPRIYAYRGNTGVDNSYAFLLWKTGVVGLFIFLSIYAKALKDGIATFWYTANSEVQVYVMGLLGGMAGILTVALTNMSIVQYRFNIIWAAILALLHSVYQLQRSKE